MTHFEEIKQMNVEDLANVLQDARDDICFEMCEKNTGNKYSCPYEEQDCTACIAKWLESEVTK